MSKAFLEKATWKWIFESEGRIWFMYQDTNNLLTSMDLLTVGLVEKSRALENLPVRVYAKETGAEAISCLRKERIDVVMSVWDLIDMPCGQLLWNIKEARPGLRMFSFIESGNAEQEIAARSLGVSAVFSSDISDGYFIDVVEEILGVSAVTSMVGAGYEKRDINATHSSSDGEFP